MSAGVRERPTDQCLLEFLLESIADAALATQQRLRKLAIERLLPADLRRDAASATPDLAHFGRQVGKFNPLAGPHHRHPMANVLELANIAGKRKCREDFQRIVG